MSLLLIIGRLWDTKITVDLALLLTLELSMQSGSIWDLSTCMVVNISQKISLISQLVEAPEFIESRGDFPTINLSHYQSLFHQALVNKSYQTGLLLARAKFLLKGNR